MNSNLNLRIKAIRILTVCLTLIFANSVKAQDSYRVHNIVLVHGAFVDGSGWKPVYEMLIKKGYKVSVTQHALTTFEGDVAAVKRIIDQQDGPCILVGHSYGGAVITAAGNDPLVAGLVYIAAHAPDNGESEAGNGKMYPSAYKSLIKGKDGLDYINPKSFAADFSADLPVIKAVSWPIPNPPLLIPYFTLLFETLPGKRNPAGIWLQNLTGSSTLIWKECMQNGLKAIP